MNRAAMTPRFLAFAILTCALTLAGCGSEPQQSQASAAPLAGAAIGGPFTLVAPDGKTVRWQDFAGRYRIVYFGYTFCPDACPLDLGKMMQGFALFAKAQPALADKIQPMFITIDPARDTPKIMGEYTASFSPRLLGLTGSQAAIDQAAKAFRVYYAKGDKTPGGGYLMNHSRVALLMGPQGEPISMLPVDQDPPAVAAELAKWVK
jgi:protein SCO1/2